MNLSKLRRDIDRIDRDIVRLLNARTRTAIRIGRIKESSGEPVFVAPREREVLDRISRANKGPLPNASLRHIYREIMSAARAMEGSLTIACTHASERAARAKFGDSVTYLTCTSAAAAGKAVGAKAQFAVLAHRAGLSGMVEEFENDGHRFAVVARPS